MSARTRLFKLKKPYDNGESDALFLKAMQENCAFQYENCPEYRKILDTKGFSPKDLKEYRDLERLPFLPTLYLKHHAVFSMPQRRMLIKATSSGTSGTTSRMGYNFMSLYRGLRMILMLGKYHRLFSLKPVHYLILGYEPNKANKTVISKTSYGFTYFAPALSRDYALRYTKDGYKLDLEHLKARLIKFSRSKHPVRTAGFPAYTYFFVEANEGGRCTGDLAEGVCADLGRRLEAILCRAS